MSFYVSFLIIISKYSKRADWLKMGKQDSASDGTAKDSFLKNYALASGASGLAELVTYPLDITRTRLQVQGEHAAQQFVKNTVANRGTIKTITGIVKEEGIRKLYQGLSPAILRHFVYGGSRMQIYEYLRKENMKQTDDVYFPVWKAGLFGAFAGVGGQFLASPTDLVKIQMQMEGRRSLQGYPKRFNGTLDAFYKISKKRGMRGLWRGWVPNCQRAALVNFGDLMTYDSAKHFLTKEFQMADSYVAQTIASLMSGFAAAVLCCPADVVKTRVMNEPDLYKGSVDCFVKAVKQEGVFALYKGFFPCWIRLAPWYLTFWLTYEQLRSLASSSSF